MRIRQVRTALAAIAIVATTLVAHTPPAQAEVIRDTFDVETVAGPPPADGSARTKGELAWHDKTWVVADGWINDRCPGDGYGAYLDVSVQYMDNDVNPRKNVAKDTRTCDAAGGAGLAFPSPITFNSTRWIKAIRFCLWEIDMDPNPPRGGHGACETYPNPHTN